MRGLYLTGDETTLEQLRELALGRGDLQRTSA